jgi:hypothetical protein
VPQLSHRQLPHHWQLASNGIALERVRRPRSALRNFSGAADAGYLFGAGAWHANFAGNTVTACGNGGILVHRWAAGADGTLITGNRV